MAKISALKLGIPLLLSALAPASVSCEEQPPHKYILAIAQLTSPKYLTSPSEEVGGPYEGKIFLGGVYGVKVKILRVISGSFDVTPKRLRLIANSQKYFTKSAPKLVFIRKYEKFGYRITNWNDITDQQSRNVCLPESEVKVLESGAMFTAPDGHGSLCEHRPHQSQG
ncbi:hypothetical protein ABC974_18110 [Sphingomonas oligophenolica]|uniref:DUF3108 domain-containing protein n=1 Tax=Sphingomonas oligophenolica TaxID=301154 RepID=A0ABU9Y6W7_9SPHN